MTARDRYRTEPHPEMRRVLETIAERLAGRPRLADLPVQQVRDLMARDVSLWDAAFPEELSLADHWCDGASGALRLKSYCAPDLRPGVVYYIHGGGWLAGSIETHDGVAARLALATRRCVVSVNYALAPEVRYPVPLEDCLAGYDWLCRRLAGEPPADAGSHSGSGSGQGIANDGFSRALASQTVADAGIVIAGDSAGANLALAAALRLRDQERSRPPAALCLFYGAYDPANVSRSHELFGEGSYGLTTDFMARSWSAYAGGCDLSVEPSFAPICGDFRGLPAALVVAAGLDCLLDDSIALAEKMTADGAELQLRIADGLIHGFAHMAPKLACASAELDAAAEFVRRALDGRA